MLPWRRRRGQSGRCSCSTQLAGADAHRIWPWRCSLRPVCVLQKGTEAADKEGRPYEGIEEDDEYCPGDEDVIDQDTADAAEVERFLNLLADGKDLPPDPRVVSA